jgi:hypothetical protein
MEEAQMIHTKGISIVSVIRCEFGHNMHQTLTAPYYQNGRLVGKIQRFHCDKCHIDREIITAVLPERHLDHTVINSDRI